GGAADLARRALEGADDGVGEEEGEDDAGDHDDRADQHQLDRRALHHRRDRVEWYAHIDDADQLLLRIEDRGVVGEIGGTIAVVQADPELRAVSVNLHPARDRAGKLLAERTVGLPGCLLAVLEGGGDANAAGYAAGGVGALEDGDIAADQLLDLIHEV